MYPYWVLGPEGSGEGQSLVGRGVGREELCWREEVRGHCLPDCSWVRHSRGGWPSAAATVFLYFAAYFSLAANISLECDSAYSPYTHGLLRGNLNRTPAASSSMFAFYLKALLYPNTCPFHNVTH